LELEEAPPGQVEEALMVDAGTLLLLIVNAVFFLAMLALVLWPLFAALLEILKVIRGLVMAPPSAFVLTSDGATIERARSGSATSKSLSAGDERLRRSVIFACGMEAAFVIFLAVFLLQHADPRGDGMEMVGVGFAFMIIFLPLTLPAFIFARNGRWLVLSAGLAAFAAVAYFALWLEVVSELGLPKS
jgi:hypothetical protein